MYHLFLIHTSPLRFIFLFQIRNSHANQIEYGCELIDTLVKISIGSIRYVNPEYKRLKECFNEFGIKTLVHE